MTARPSHYAQQKVIDDAMASLPSSRWRWLFTPDPRWLAAINTTTLREVNAVRMFVGVTLLFFASYSGVIAFALLRCGLQLNLFGYKVLQILPPSGKLDFNQWQVCENANATQTMLGFADGLFNGYAILLGVMASVAVGGNILKRVTDTEHQVKVQEAKKAPIILPPTGEHQAQQPPVRQEVNVNVGEATVVEEPPEGEEHEWAAGDPRSGVL